MNRIRATDKEVLDNVILAETQAHGFGTEILEALHGGEGLLPLVVRFRAAGQLMSAFAEAKVRTEPGLDPEERKELFRVLEQVDEIVVAGARRGEATMVPSSAEQN
jgi:hypothetical protein